MKRHDPALAELRANVAVPFERATAMPKSVYTSPDFAALEEAHIFAKEWLCAGRADALPTTGDYLTMDISGEPIIILRDRDGVTSRKVVRLFLEQLGLEFVPVLHRLQGGLAVEG